MSSLPPTPAKIAEPSFWTDLVSGLLQDSCSYQANNVDRLRFPERPGAAESFRHALCTLASRFGFRRRNFSLRAVKNDLAEVFAHADRYERAWRGLADDESRQLFVHLLRFRLLGHNHVRLPLNNPEYHRGRDSVRQYLREEGAIRIGPQALHRYELPFGPDTIRATLTPGAINQTFIHRQYELHRAPAIAAEPGDYTIDAGGCWGDTALYFASRVGAQGRVYCFEFEPGNLAVLQANLDANPALASRVEVVRCAVSDQSDLALSYQSGGPGSRLQPGQSGEATATTLSIDDLVERRKVPRIDFIKMDIEGAELAALQGARQTLQRFRPKLAISIYHKAEDFYEIQEFIAGLDLGYRFYLDHATIHGEETLLFCSAPRTETALSSPHFHPAAPDGIV